MKAHIAISGLLFAATMIGTFVLIFLLPDRLSPWDPPYTAYEQALWVVGVVLALPALPLNLLVEWIQPPRYDINWTVGCNLASSLLWAFALVRVWQFWRNRKTEPGAPPNGGPATPAGDSGVAEGPPSVS
jgi:hypothetical protein